MKWGLKMNLIIIIFIFTELLCLTYLQLLEPNVLLRVRETDVGLTESILPVVTEQYTKTSGSEITVKIDQDHFLPVECCGGVDLLAFKGKIKIANSLEARLDLIAQQLVPQIRNALFGVNTNRKFTD